MDTRGLHRTRTLVVVVAVLLLAGGCGSQGPDGPAAGTPDPGPVASLRIEGRAVPGRDGEMFTEGAVQEVALTDPAGRRVEPDRSDTDGHWAYVALPFGSYLLSARQRPCDGNCGTLDPPVDGCTTRLDLAGDTDVEIVFHVGDACEITAE